MTYDSLYYPYPSKRTVIHAQNGMVAASQPLAAQAGLDILKQGGNAIDAAIAAATCLTVVEPTANGVGGDAFALVWYEGKLYGLNASGPAPRGLSAPKLKAEGYMEVPRYGWQPVTVPGAPAAWAAMAERFGSLPLTRSMQAAVEYAEKGYPVSPVVGQCWQDAYRLYKSSLQKPYFKYWFDTFAPKGRAPTVGEVWQCGDLARSLERIAVTNGKAFYQGVIADALLAFSHNTGGYLDETDLGEFVPEWVEPISIRYRGYDVWEIPPNGHGLVALLALNIAGNFEFDERDTSGTYHRQIEAMKLAFADGMQYIADPCRMKVSVQQLLSEDYAKLRAACIGRQALLPQAGSPHSGGTVYLATADTNGSMVSYIQSNYMGFGSGLVVPGTGISLHNRGCNFVLDESHVNCLRPGVRPYHTIIPGFLTKDGQPVGPFGVMGAFMQPQGHMQMIMNTLDFTLNPQAALDAPRWQWKRGLTVEVEQHTDGKIIEELRLQGHDVVLAADARGFGRGQIIWRNSEGVLQGGTEPRTDGYIACW